MISTQSDEPCNLAMVMIITIAQLMKITYFFFHRYATVIFGQAITILSSAFLLTFLKFKYSKDSHSARCAFPEPSHVVHIRLTETFIEHLCVLTIYAGVMFIVFLTGCGIFGKSSAVDTLGLLGNLLDTTVSFPLFLQIVIRRDVNNISSVLVVQYIVGDIMKLFTFMFVATPWVFVFGAYCQCSIDGLTSLTFFHLQRRAKSHTESPIPPDESRDEFELIVS
jgi:hypothetical protein